MGVAMVSGFGMGMRMGGSGVVRMAGHCCVFMWLVGVVSDACAQVYFVVTDHGAGERRARRRGWCCIRWMAGHVVALEVVGWGAALWHGMGWIEYGYPAQSHTQEEEREKTRKRLGTWGTGEWMGDGRIGIGRITVSVPLLIF